MTIFVQRKATQIIGLLGILLLGNAGGCSSAPDNIELINEQVPDAALGNVEYHTYVLANELFANLRPVRQSRYAVTGFVPVDSLAYNENLQHPLQLLGHQLQEGLLTEATKRGFTAQEFRLTQDIIVSDRSDRVLSRDIELLTAMGRIDYFITGTLVHQEAGAIVNARIIDAQTRDVVAAATRFFPAELFWQTEQVTSRNGRLYRTENKG
ncbi:FlgO family outer membrane protein [Alteromonas gilva]|uniref:FlgO family outer membrane protein n=1 Tax=Alteromonas gilva TaxID=2987522 RepID=A0ABT5L445_9ALTE|nr:FlgO family outer membrane protein [Alteromonas gilva]MDC8830632.1 FlgO family outer membrane protein [Alteromonas gilva]